MCEACGVSHAAATHTVELCGSWCSVSGNVSGVSVHASVVVLCVVCVVKLGAGLEWGTY